MFQKLQEKWKVSGWQVLIILTTFAIGGSLTGYLGRKLMALIGVNDGWFFLPIYILVITILWPLMVLLVSFPLGQFRFFRRYLGRMGAKMGIVSAKQRAAAGPAITRIAIFASGAGSNALKIIEHFKHHPSIKVVLIVCNKPGAGVLQIAASHHIDTLLLEKEAFFRGHHYIPSLHSKGIDFIVLAGFLWKVPAALVAAYPQRIINIHPALLPAYGGKGMYGNFVHEAVIAAGERQSGITIHYVDEQYDHGSTIFQATCPIDDGDNAASLAKKIHELEHRHFAQVIEEAVIKVQKMG